MILIDANILIYAINRDATMHASARQWLEQSLSSDQDIGLAWIVILAFLRITTHPSIMESPLSASTAIEYVDVWLSQPTVNALSPGEQHWNIFNNLLESTGTAGNLTSDAHLAALAVENGGTIYSADNDFKRFPGVKHVNPLVL